MARRLPSGLGTGRPELAAERISNAGGVLGCPIKVMFDDQSAAPDVLVQDMARDKMFAAAGFDSSDPAIRVIPEIMKQKMILMVTGAGSPQITESVTRDPQSNRYLFRNGNDAQAWATSTAVFLREIQKARSYFYLSQSNQFGRDMEASRAGMVKSEGINQVGSFCFTRGSKADRDIEVLEGALALIKDKDPDVVISHLGPTVCSFLKVYRERQVPLPLYDIAANSVELED